MTTQAPREREARVRKRASNWGRSESWEWEGERGAVGGGERGRESERQGKREALAVQAVDEPSVGCWHCCKVALVALAMAAAVKVTPAAAGGGGGREAAGGRASQPASRAAAAATTTPHHPRHAHRATCNTWATLCRWGLAAG